MKTLRLIVVVCFGVVLIGCEGSSSVGTSFSPMPDKEPPKPSIEPASATLDAQASGETQTTGAETTELYRGVENPKKVDWKGYICSATTKDSHLTRIYILYPDDYIGVDAVHRKDRELRKVVNMLPKKNVIESMDREINYEWHSAYYLAYEFPPREDYPSASFTNSNGKERAFLTVLPEKGERPSREEMDRIRKSRTSEPPRKIQK